MVPGGHCWDYNPGTLSSCQVTANHLKDQVLVDFIHRYPIYEFITVTWLNKCWGIKLVSLTISTKATYPILISLLLWHRPLIHWISISYSIHTMRWSNTHTSHTWRSRTHTHTGTQAGKYLGDNEQDWIGLCTCKLNYNSGNVGHTQIDREISARLQ